MDDDWTVGAVDHANLEEVAGGVGTNEHHEAVIEIVDEHRMVERVEHVVVVDAVLAGAGCDQRRIDSNKLACCRAHCKLPCVRSSMKPSDQWCRATISRTDLVAAIEAGKTIREIATEHRVTGRTVQVELRRFGLVEAHRHRPNT